MNPLFNVLNLTPDRHVQRDELPDNLDSLMMIPETVSCEVDFDVGDDVIDVNRSFGTVVSIDDSYKYIDTIIRHTVYINKYAPFVRCCVLLWLWI